jgi:hypothetical protein
MEISKEELEEFKRIYKEELNEDLPDDEAREVAQRLLAFTALVYRPLPEGKEPEESSHMEL